MKFDNNIKMTIIAFVTLCFGIFYMKPEPIFNKDGSLKDHVTDLKETQTKLNKISYSAYVPTLIAQIEYKMDGEPFYIDYEAALYENRETLKELDEEYKEHCKCYE